MVEGQHHRQGNTSVGFKPHSHVESAGEGFHAAGPAKSKVTEGDKCDGAKRRGGLKALGKPGSQDGGYTE